MDPHDEALSEPFFEETPLRPAPVMDVVPPPAASSAPATPEADPKKHPADHPAEPKPPRSTKKPAAPPRPDAPREPGSGVTAAITATVIIVLGLAALAVFAYLKSQ